MIIQPIYKIKNLYHKHGPNPILKIKKLVVMPSSVIGFIGSNGSGKSTLLNIMAFLYQPDQGEIFFDGRVVNSINKSIRLKVTLLPQKTLLMKRTVYQNTIYGLKIRNFDKKYYFKLAKMALEMVGLDFKIFFNRRWNTLSGGEAQRVALAARLVLRPKVLLMDEPTVNIDSNSNELIKKALIIAKKKWGTTLIITSHDLDWINSVCDKVMFIHKGKLVTVTNKNIITGPWIKINNDTFTNRTLEGQRIIVNQPKNKDSIAIINPFDITIHDRGYDTRSLKKNPTIDGIIRQLKLEKQNKNISIQIDIGDSILTSIMETKKITKMGIYPGKKVIITYPVEQIQWI